MLTLYVLRHAEAVSDQGNDKARALSPHGRLQAQSVGARMDGHDLAPPSFILHSSARRVRETVAGLGMAADMRAMDELYNASPERILAVLRDHGQDKTPLLLAGHNPGVSMATRLLAADGRGAAIDDGLYARMEAGFTPATLAVFECRVARWADLTLDGNRLLAFDYPSV
jgi:phosphohistidine phosphatase